MIIATKLPTPKSLGQRLKSLTKTSSIKCLSQVHAEEKQSVHKEQSCDTKLIKPVIGLEVHAQINLKSKLFSQGSNLDQAAPNSQLDLLDIALPGTLPKLNKTALKSAILTGLALNCNIQDVIHFDRKNYFYTDMPAGFQITQYNRPIARDGFIDFIVTSHHKSVIAHSEQYDVVKYLFSGDRFRNDINPYLKRSRITQLQLEQDSAKTLHRTNSNEDLDNLIDYNRSGAALIEIVFEPDLTSSEEATALVKELIVTLKSIGTCDCELQDGSLRVDANVSIKSIAGQELNSETAPRVELKNLNSLKALDKGISYEIKRQASIIEAGERVLRESRTFDSKSGKTILLREKESAMDYRYVFEPNIPPLQIGQDSIEEARRLLPANLPCRIWQNLIDKFNLDLVLVVEIMGKPGLDEYLGEIMQDKHYDPNVVADFLIYSLTNLENIDGLPLRVDLRDRDGDLLSKLPARKMQKLFDMMFADEIGFSTAYEVMKCLFTSHSSHEPDEIVSEFDWKQINDENEVVKYCEQLIRGMKSVSKKYAKTGQKKHLRLMLTKLSQLHNNRVSIKKAIYCLDKLLKPRSAS